MNKPISKAQLIECKIYEGTYSNFRYYKKSRLEHSLQTATRAYNDNAEEEMVVAAYYMILEMS